MFLLLLLNRLSTFSTFNKLDGVILRSVIKCPDVQVFWPLFSPVFGVNVEIYRVNLRIQFKYGIIRNMLYSM